MNADSIRVRLEEAEGVIAIPRGAVFEKDGKRVVYRREGGGFVPVEITIGRLTVVGVLESGGTKREIQGVTLEGTANDIYLPVTAAQRRFGRAPLKAPLDELVVSMAPGTPVQESAAVVSTLLDRLHGGAADYTITVPEALLEQSRRTQRLFDIVMGAIAGISLLVGGIGIMNIMLATVLERTQEIGVRRAMGARQVDIRNQFVMEAFAVTVTGGVWWSSTSTSSCACTRSASPRRRGIFRKRREPLRDLSRCGAEALSEYMRRAVGADTRPGIVVSVATSGDLLQWHVHLHVLATDGVFSDDGTFHPLATWDAQALMRLFRERLLARLVERHPGEAKVEAEPAKKRRCSASWARLIAKVFHADPLTCRKCGGKPQIVAYLHDTVAIKQILDYLGLSPPEEPKPPPAVHEVVRVPVDEEGREMEAP